MTTQDLYIAEIYDPGEGAFSATIRFNASHPVFAGHFPGQPIVPGVWLVRIIHEVISRHLEKECMLKEAQHVKFLQVIDPVRSPEVTMNVKYSGSGTGEVSAGAEFISGGVVLVKFKGLFSELSA
jgi:3-hydroxyacyl-[acyl-carrier-protein] dehydratase